MTKSIENKIHSNSRNLIFVPIQSADQFALDLGKELGLKGASDIARVYRIFSWFKPNSLSHFANGATLQYTAGEQLQISFQMGTDLFPGNNHAGLNIDTVEHQISIDQYQKIRIHYTVEPFVTISEPPGFEFKLHSTKNAWSYHVPFHVGSIRYHAMPLQLFRDNDVDLNNIWRVVVAADVKCLGVGGAAKISISQTELL